MMKTKSMITGGVAAAAMFACLIPLCAQESNSETVAAQRQRNDLLDAAQSARFGQQTAPNANFNEPMFPSERQLHQALGLNSNAPQALATARSFFGQSALRPELAIAINTSNENVGKLIKQLRDAEADTEKEEIKAKLKTELDTQYDAYLEHHEQPLKQLEERLAKLRDEFEARKKAKTDLVKLRLDTIWYDALGLGWPSNRTTSMFGNNGLGLPGQTAYPPYPASSPLGNPPLLPNSPPLPPARLPLPAGGSSR